MFKTFKRILASFFAVGMIFAISFNTIAIDVKYDSNTDYMALMIKYAKIGDAESLRLGKIMEDFRNAKILDLKLPYKTTSYFKTYSTGSQIIAAINGRPYTLEELNLLSKLVATEMGADWVPDWSQRAVVSIVINRVKDKRFPNTIRDVLYQPGQFNPWSYAFIYAKPSNKILSNVKYILENGPNLPEGVVYESLYILGPVSATYYDPWMRNTTYFCY